MKRTRRNRVVIAWALLFALMPITIVKATHFHHNEDAAVPHSALAGHAHDAGSEDCPICNFFLSPFVETSDIHFAFCATLVCVFIARPCEGGEQAVTSSVSLRAPPAARLS